MTLTLAPPPETPVEPVTEVLHGVSVTDPYRWLEDQNSPRTRNWLEEQSTYTHKYFDAISGRNWIRTRVRELLSVPSATEPWKVGDQYFYLKRFQDNEQPVIMTKKGLHGRESVLIDPRSYGENSASVAIATISPDGRFLAYTIRRGGTDHASLEILDLWRNTVLPDKLPEGICTGIAFASDATGFFYAHRELHGPRPNRCAAFWHSFGTERSQDRVVFDAGEKPNLFLGILYSSEAKLLIYDLFSIGKNPSSWIYLSGPSPEATPKLLLHHGGSYFIPFWVRGQLLALTNSAAPNFRIVHINLDDPSPKSWRDVVPESDRRIKDFAVAANRIFVTRVDHFSTKIEVFDLDNGDQKTDIPLPPHGSARLIDFTHGADEAFYSYTSITQPPVVYRYDAKNEKVEVWEKIAHFSAQAAIAVEQVSYLSNDGTEVPMLLAAREDLIHSGPLPTFLTGYGGFGSCVTPRFTAHASFLLEHGLLLAVPAVRGGSELGEQWHLAGRREKRQNCFDDFVAAAEWLITEGRSESGRIAIGGGSNAGLLVGAVITQRPDLFRAAICIGPLLDMIRYHLFDFAAGWADEYGSPEDPADFSSLSSYSPYHNAINNKSYPAVLFVSGDADTRCNPMHARKMVARLQAASTSGYPILLDYKEEWGHMPVQPLSTKIEGLVDRLTFLCHELQVELHSRRLS